MEKNTKPNFMEITWLTVAVVCLGYGIYDAVTNGLGAALRFFFFSVIAIALYFFRRHLRKHGRPYRDNL